MNTLLSFAASLAGALATIYLYSLTGVNPESWRFLGMWAIAPYLAHSVLAFSARHRRDASFAILAGTVASAGVANVWLANDLYPWIDARSRRVEPPMNCGGPLVQIGLPVLQWCFIGILGWVVLTARPVCETENGE